MLDRAFLRPILDDESLTRGLGDEEARLMIDWLAERAERLADSDLGAADRGARLATHCRESRAIGRFVHLWCHDRDYGAAVQLAGAEAVSWPLPAGPEEAPELMARILRNESRRARLAA